ncbi:uncharacterized protein LOC144139762 [Haemaphysalis longicornis]
MRPQARPIPQRFLSSCKQRPPNRWRLGCGAATASPEARCAVLAPPQLEPLDDTQRSPLLAPVNLLADLLGMLLVGKGQGLPYLLSQEQQNIDAPSYVKTMQSIRSVLASFPQLTVVAMLVALFNMIPGGILVLWRSRISLRDVAPREPDPVRLATLSALLVALLVILGALLVSGFVANAMYSDTIRRLPEHAKRFRGILDTYGEDVQNTSKCVFKSLRKHVLDSLTPAYAACLPDMVADASQFGLATTDIGPITAFVNALPAVSSYADELQVGATRLSQLWPQIEPLIADGVPEEPTKVICSDSTHGFCSYLENAWRQLRSITKDVLLAPPDVSGIANHLRKLLQQGRFKVVQEAIARYTSMTRDLNKYITTDIKGDLEAAMAAEMDAQTELQESRIVVVMAQYTTVLAWLSKMADNLGNDGRKYPPVNLASNMGFVNMLHLVALLIAWWISVASLVLGCVGLYPLSHMLGRFAEGVFSCFILQVHVVAALLFFVGLVGKRSLCDPAVSPWDDDTQAVLHQLTKLRPDDRWLGDAPGVLRRCHQGVSVYEAFRTDTVLTADKSGVAAPVGLAHALSAIEAMPPLNTRGLFLGLRSNLLSDQQFHLLRTLVKLPLAPLISPDALRCKGNDEALSR